MPLDSIDHHIITCLVRDVTCLVRDARSSFREIGETIGLSAPAVKRRVDRLRLEGVITGFTARIDPGSVGWHTQACTESTIVLSTVVDRPSMPITRV